jgi:hypothetical protein
VNQILSCSSRHIKHNNKNGIQNKYHMSEINHFKVFIMCSGDVTDVDHLHVKRIHLIDFSYIVIDDSN